MKALTLSSIKITNRGPNFFRYQLKCFHSESVGLLHLSNSLNNNNALKENKGHHYFRR